MTGRKESRQARQTRALVGLLRTLDVQQLVDVLDGVDAVLKNPPAEHQPRASKRCGYCSEVFPRCRAMHADDHEFEEMPS